jgi:hypothetical protein
MRKTITEKHTNTEQNSTTNMMEIDGVSIFSFISTIQMAITGGNLIFKQPHMFGSTYLRNPRML